MRKMAGLVAAAGIAIGIILVSPRINWLSLFFGVSLISAEIWGFISLILFLAYGRERWYRRHIARWIVDSFGWPVIVAQGIYLACAPFPRHASRSEIRRWPLWPWQKP